MEDKTSDILKKVLSLTSTKIGSFSHTDLEDIYIAPTKGGGFCIIGTYMFGEYHTDPLATGTTLDELAQNVIDSKLIEKLESWRSQ